MLFYRVLRGLLSRGPSIIIKSNLILLRSLANVVLAQSLHRTISHLWTAYVTQRITQKKLLHLESLLLSNIAVNWDYVSVQVEYQVPRTAYNYTTAHVTRQLSTDYSTQLSTQTHDKPEYQVLNTDTQPSTESSTQHSSQPLNTNSHRFPQYNIQDKSVIKDASRDTTHTRTPILHIPSSTTYSSNSTTTNHNHHDHLVQNQRLHEQQEKKKSFLYRVRRSLFKRSKLKSEKNLDTTQQDLIPVSIVDQPPIIDDILVQDDGIDKTQQQAFKRNISIRTIKAGDESHPPILLLHGHSMSSAFFFNNIDQLVAMNYSVYAIDLPGWAFSSSPDYSQLNLNEVIQDYTTAIESWRKEVFGKKDIKLTLLGHSMGGYYATCYAWTHPHAVKRLILVSPAGISDCLPFYSAVVFYHTPRAVLRRCGILFSRFLFKLRYPSGRIHGVYKTKGLREYAYYLMAHHKISGDVAFAKGILFEGNKIATNLKPLSHAVSGPVDFSVDIVVGEKDRLVSVHECENLCKAMLTKDVRANIHVITDSFHCAHMENPDMILQIVGQSSFN